MSSESKYDRQLIIALLGNMQDAVTLAQAAALDAKCHQPPLLSEVVRVQCQLEPLGDVDGLDSLRHALAGQLQVAQAVGSRSRVYLLGECSVSAQTLAGWSVNAVASLLVDAGLLEVATISIVAGGAGRDPERDEQRQVDAGARSFASALHWTLGRTHGVRTTVHARIGDVRVLERPLVYEEVVVEAGRKVTMPMGGESTPEHHLPHSKLSFWWDADVQRCGWTY